MGRLALRSAEFWLTLAVPRCFFAAGGFAALQEAWVVTVLFHSSSMQYNSIYPDPSTTVATRPPAHLSQEQASPRRASADLRLPQLR